jgi:hypothetical protein
MYLDKRSDEELMYSDRKVFYYPGRQEILSSEDAEQMISAGFQGVDFDTLHLICYNAANVKAALICEKVVEPEPGNQR